jgi:sortase (surface protein transpeptidase)
LIWRSPGIAIDAPIVKIGLDDDGNLGSPSAADKKKVGLYTDGPMPGSGVGNVLIDGHTYRDNSAVFKENFSQKLAKGAVLSFVMDNGSSCSYKVIKVWPGISKKGSEYANLVKSEKFYDFTGPEQVFGVTCTGSWNAFARSHEAVAAFIATPIN